jgi:DNA mismatch repair ATPase MutS
VGLENHLWLLEPIFARLEKRLENTQGQSIDKILPTVKSHGPSREMRRLSRALSFAGIQANPILHLLINAVFPWSITATYVLEKLRQEIAGTLPHCLEELAEFEALMSLALLERYQTQTYPSIVDGASPRLDTGFHPLFKRSNVVANDFSFSAGKRLGLLTGSNMSGKSTFLRTLGINQVLANMGAPVFARAFTTGPYQVETCIEVSDSLRDGFSYFYAEVRRLKELISRAEKHAPSPVLYLIDEIFRGTNNRERQVGSRAVIRALAQTNAYGLVSTHDLELTSLAETQAAVENFHFREEIIETSTGKSEMHFTYHLNQGPCPTTNALRIMADEGIDVSGLEAQPGPT